MMCVVSEGQEIGRARRWYDMTCILDTAVERRRGYDGTLIKGLDLY